jgi:cytochrome b6-f complex iron-sulfur subunit
MSNYQVEPVDKPQALTTEALRSLRYHPVQGWSRRRLLRTSLGVGIAVWLVEVGGGTIGFLWPNLAGGFGGALELGTFDSIKTENADIPWTEGFPAYYPLAKAFVMLVDPSKQEFVVGADKTGDGTELNVRVLYQRCPHLGCKPNACEKNFWFECPCHGSRYDRLGIKAAGSQFGPAPRSMDRFAIAVDGDGVLIVDTAKINLGPLPVALGQPGIEPPLSPTGCI